MPGRFFLDASIEDPNLTMISQEASIGGQKKLAPELDGIRQIMPGLASAMGPGCELVLHDFYDLSQSLVAIEGNLTGRTPGMPLTDLVLQIIRTEKAPTDKLNYLSHTHDGRMLRCSTIFIRDSEGNVIGCLCINRDLTELQAARNLLESLCQTRPLESINAINSGETFVQDVEELLSGTINEIVALGKKPVQYMDKTDKMRVIRELDAKGIFLIRGAVKTVALALNVSRFTIYNYLDEARR